MKINEKILEKFKDVDLSEEEGVPYLLSLYYGYNPAYIPSYVKVKISLSGILTPQEDNIIWNIPMFEQVEVKNTWDWVAAEYVELFAPYGKNKNKKECLTRMKKLFAENPEIRKEDVLGATKLYLEGAEPKFVRLPHYFIEKGVGSSKTQDILSWIEIYKEDEERSQNDSREFDLTRKLQ